MLLLVIGINNAAISLTSVNYGAGRIDRVREVYRSGLTYALGLMLVGAIRILLFAEQFLGVFTDDAAVLEVGMIYLRFEAFILPACALTFLSAAVLQGLEKPAVALYFNIARQLVGQLLLFWIAVDLLEMNINGVWWSVPIFNWVMAVGIVVVVRRHLSRLSLPVVESLR